MGSEYGPLGNMTNQSIRQSARGASNLSHGNDRDGSGRMSFDHQQQDRNQLKVLPQELLKSGRLGTKQSSFLVKNRPGASADQSMAFKEESSDMRASASAQQNNQFWDQ